LLKSCIFKKLKDWLKVSFEDDFSGYLLNVLARKGTHGVEVVAALAFDALKRQKRGLHKSHSAEKNCSKNRSLARNDLLVSSLGPKLCIFGNFWLKCWHFS
jgi:hypothetical protein